uniref:Arylacetamide deacetylase like 2 n=1 Tax=Propithecus coquereli TaxID=379532 RepID=A0A2K6EHN0_PROCO
MGFKALCLGLLFGFFVSYIRTPIPDNVEESWKIMALDITAKILSLMAMCFEKMGIIKYEEFISIIISLDYTQPHSDEYLTVTDTAFIDIPVRLYLPKRKSEIPRRAIIYVHGGAFCFGSFYRLAPQHKFPVPFEDVLTAAKFFLQDKILTKYGVDPTRICISGDSAGSALAAAVTQQIQNDPEIKHKFKTQALIYPVLQLIDSSLPSYRENEHGIVLTRDIAIKLASSYLSEDEAFPQAIKRNRYMPLESKHLFKFVNWSILLPEKYRKDHVYTEPILGRPGYSLPALMDDRASPLLASDSQLQNLPLTYILTCEYDVLRDDGLMFVSRLQNVGVQVTHDHIENGIHGALAFMMPPLYLRLGFRIRDMYISWLDKNL